MRSKNEKKKRKKLRKKLTAKGGADIELDRDVIKSQAEINEELRLLRLRN